MTSASLTDVAATALRRLCLDVPTRRVGSAGNRAATEWLAAELSALGWATETPRFECLDWHEQGANLTVAGQAFPVQASPYTLGICCQAPLVAAATVDELAAAEATDRVLLLRGQIAREQLMPKGYPFYNPEEHQQVYALVEGKQPRAVVCATSRNPQMAGAVYPFPLFYDGNFHIPSVYTTEQEGERLAALAGQEAQLAMRAQRQPAHGCNVVARKGRNAPRRAVLFAHIDTSVNTPGAVDNAAGVATLLLVAKLLKDYASDMQIELVAVNGEDDYSAAGELLWLAQNQGRLEEIGLGINLDALGFHRGRTAYSLYGCPPPLEQTIHAALAAHEGLMEGEPWYQSDHAVLMQKGVPALAVTSEGVGEILATVAHSQGDLPEVVDPQRLATASLALRDLLLHLASAA
ncbi:MAG: Zn-dependent exopeptidase M28 [Chloroflexi bacterium]|nr:Zn-dependent exopeptidase M28 [Chloroflexota bacterium]